MRNDAPFVLVVDSCSDASESIRDVLSLYGITVRTAASCAEAVAMTLVEHPAAVVTDMRLPDGDGNMLVGLLRETISPWTAVIAIGSSPRSEDDRFSDWFLKPAEPMQLAEALRRHVPQSFDSVATCSVL